MSIKSTASLVSFSIILALPIILALANDAWMFTPAGWLDPWIYVGYAFHYSDPSFLNDYYKISRLPWIFLEYGAHTFFSPLVANTLLQLGCLTIATVSVFFVVRLLFGKTAAMVAAGLLAVYTHFVGSGGADYHNTLSGPLYAFTFLLLTLGARGDRSFYALAFVTGALYAATIHTNVIYVNLAPILAIQFLTLWYLREGVRTSPLAAAASAIFGAVGLTVFLGILNYSVGRNFAFFLPQFRLATDFVENRNLNIWWKPWISGWYLSASYLGPLAAGAALAVVASAVIWFRKRWLCRGKFPERQIFALSINFQFVCLVGLWLFWQSVGQTALDPTYFAAPLIVPFSLVIGVGFGLFGLELGPRGRIAMGLVLAK